MSLFRGIKDLRNAMAHRVNIGLLSPKAQKALDKLRLDLPKLGPEVAAAAARSRKDEETARWLILNTLAALSYVLKKEHGTIRRLEETQQE